VRNIFKFVEGQVLDVLREMRDEGTLAADEAALARVTAEPPRDERFGEASTNAAMMLAKPNKANPKELAKRIAARLRGKEGIASAVVEGPGFINLTLVPDIWRRALEAMLRHRERYDAVDVGKGKRVNIEFVSANPTGPMHIGHARGAVFGDALASIMARAGYEVTREYYVNDAGAQVATLVDSVYHRYRERCGETPGELPKGCYPGDYVKDVAEALYEAHGDALRSDPNRRAVIEEAALSAMLALIKEDLRRLGVRHDLYVSEKALKAEGLIENSIRALEEGGRLYRGVLEPPKGKRPDDWEPREQLLFRSTAFGDDMDRALAKSDGSHTYFAGDVAYHFHKVRRGYDALAIVLGADHGGYVQRLRAVVSVFSDGKIPIDVKIMQIVRYVKGGVPMKMSKRAGVYETALDVVEEFGKDAVRFMMLTRRGDVPLDFDADLVREQSKDNPVFYVQYAHARACSVFRHAKEAAPEALAFVEKGEVPPGIFARLSHEAESQLLRKLAEWPRCLEQAAVSGEPHRIAGYAQQVAQSFHALWSRGNEDAEMRFILPGDKEATAARLALVAATAAVLRAALETVGVTPAETM
jgi:arginyl-tRNA synthetase